MKTTKPSWSSDQTAAENARKILPGLAESFVRLGRKVAHDRAAAKALHSFRLQAKRLRYCLELFQPCYGPGLKERLDVLKRVQDYLGALNDTAVTRTMLRDAAAKRLPEAQQLDEFLRARAEEKKSEFLHYWRETCDSPEHLRWWKDYLKRFSGKNNARHGKNTARSFRSNRKPPTPPD